MLLAAELRATQIFFARQEQHVQIFRLLPCVLRLLPEPELVTAAFSTPCVDHRTGGCVYFMQEKLFFFFFFFFLFPGK